MNYATHAIEHFRTKTVPALSSKGYFMDAGVTNVISDEIQNFSVKFLLPPDGDVGLKPSGAVLNMIRAPYPLTIFEYEMLPPKSGEWTSVSGSGVPVEPSCKRVSIVWRCSKTESMTPFAVTLKKQRFGENSVEEGIFVGSLFAVMDSTGREMWVLNPGVNFIELGAECFSRPHPTTGNLAPAFSVRLLVTHPNMFKELVDMMGLEGAERNVHDDLSDEVGAAVVALAAMNARNVHPVDIPVSEKLNLKRKKNGKTPFFQYKVLDIFLNDSVVRNRDKVSSALKRFSSGCKLHAVRGHYKIRSTGIFWWSNFVRGRKENGSVQKEYAIKVEN